MDPILVVVLAVIAIGYFMNKKNGSVVAGSNGTYTSRGGATNPQFTIDEVPPSVVSSAVISSTSSRASNSISTLPDPVPNTSGFESMMKANGATWVCLKSGMAPAYGSDPVGKATLQAQGWSCRQL